MASIRSVAWRALLAGAVIMMLKFGVFLLTNSAAALTDSLESIINLVAAGVMLYSIWLSNRPADEDHPYGHGKVEFMTAGLEAWMILIAGLVIGYEAIKRLINPVKLVQLDLGLALIGVIAVLSLALAIHVWHSGKRYGSLALIADGKHLLTDVASTIGVMIGLVLVRVTGYEWIDPVVAIVMAVIILHTSWRLMWQSIDGLMDRTDPEDDKLIQGILDKHVASRSIRGYHKVRHRHNGAFHWVDMHLHVEGHLTVQQAHDLASGIEHEIEQALGQANATAHVEPHYEPAA